MPMEEQKYFKQAISNFTYEAACGGAIRHLADLGYSVRKIMEQLSFPVPYERVQKTVWEHFLEKGVLLLEEPGKGKVREEAAYVKEYNQYGRASFRRVITGEKDAGVIHFKERHFDVTRDGDFRGYFIRKCKENEMDGYVSLDFGKKDTNEMSIKEILPVLDACQRDYMEGLFGEKKESVYHRINTLMRDIVIQLYENGKYHGICYFIKTEEMIIL